MNASVPTPSRQASQRGFSLSEMLVAIAVFSFVILAAYQVFTRSRESYMLGAATADMVQGARVAFDQMNDDIRLAGYEFDVDGIEAPYPNQPDEPLEYMHPRAIVIRGNLDFDKELRGREKRLENDDPSALTTCCPIVTTANDEIVAYYLGKPSGTQPTGIIGFGADTTGTNEDPNLVDASIRDATVDPTTGAVHGEEWVTIDGVNLLAPSDVGYAPPYTLYRAYIRDNSTLIEKTPLVDNIYSLEFTYYDQAGNVVVGPSAVGVQEDWGGTQGNVQGNSEVDGTGGRATRWKVRQVKVKLVTLTPDRDLRLARANPTNIDHLGGKRKFTLEADLLPPNLGVRGAKDRDITPPEPPRNVTICTGECNMVRVSWDPGPPEDRVADHIVVICNGQCDGTNPIATKIVFASFDAVTNKEYAVLTSEDDPSIQNGVDAWAWVIARNVTGTESECPVSDCVTCCKSQTGSIIGTQSRIESYLAAAGSGYDPAETNWPDAKKNNVAGSPIVFAPTLGAPDFLPNPNYPHQDEIAIALTAPAYMLNVAPGAGGAPTNWTTKTDPAQSDPALACFAEEATPGNIADDPNLRTPAAILPEDAPANTYVFRVSGSDNTNWGAGVTDPRNFVPSAQNLYDFTDVPGSSTYVSGSGYSYDDKGDQDWSNDLWSGSDLALISTAAAGRPVRAVTPGEVYYYRFRTVDVCWKDTTNPAHNSPLPDGLEDSDPTKTAWMRRSDFASDNAWRVAAMDISPFYPPILNQGDVAGQRDKPDPGVHDADAIAANVSPDTYALPAYAIPQVATDSTYIKPDRPSEFYLAKMDETRVNPLDVDGDGLTDARVVFNAGRRNHPVVADWPPKPVAYTRYRLYRKAASSPSPSASEFNFGQAVPYLEFRTAGRLGLSRLTLDSAAEGAPDPASKPLLQDIGELYSLGTNPYIYWLTTVQCTEFDDGIDTSSGDVSAPSRPFLLPCAFYDQVDAVDIAATGGVVHFTVTMHDDVDGSLNCDAVKAARLLAYRNSDGDFVGSSAWIDAQDPGGSHCVQQTFNATSVNQALRGYSDPAAVSYVVELSDNQADKTLSVDGDPIGCRVRSDLLGDSANAGPQVLGVGCSIDCGTVGSEKVFGAVNDSVISLVDADSLTRNVMRIAIPRDNACTNSFSVEQLEFKLTKNGAIDNIIPSFVSATIVGGLQGGGQFTLPNMSPLELQANEADLDGSNGDMRLRWYDSFCNGGNCSYPRVEAGTNPLIVELHFAGELCDVKLAEFNFRVPYDSGGPRQLLCSQRLDPAPPLAGSVAPGIGRGPATNPEAVCVGCTLVACPTCKCPLQDNGDGDIAMDNAPTKSLSARLDDGTPNAVLRLGYTENSACDSPTCSFELNAFKIRIECDNQQNCIDGVDFINLLDFNSFPVQLIHGDLTSVNLPNPQDIDDSTEPWYTEYGWRGLSIPIVDGETFQLKLTYDTNLTTARITILDLRVGGALPSVCDANGQPGVGGSQASLCRPPVLPIDLP